MLRADNQATPASFKSSTRNQKVSQLCTLYISHIAISHACCIPLATIPLCKGELSARQQRQHGFLRSPPSAYSHTFHVNLCVGQVVYTQNVHHSMVGPSGRLGRTSNTSHVLHKILRGRGLSSFLVKHERSHVPMPRALQQSLHTHLQYSCFPAAAFSHPGSFIVLHS